MERLKANTQEELSDILDQIPYDNEEDILIELSGVEQEYYIDIKYKNVTFDVPYSIILIDDGANTITAQDTSNSRITGKYGNPSNLSIFSSDIFLINLSLEGTININLER